MKAINEMNRIAKYTQREFVCERMTYGGNIFERQTRKDSAAQWFLRVASGWAMVTNQSELEELQNAFASVQ